MFTILFHNMTSDIFCETKEEHRGEYIEINQRKRDEVYYSWSTRNHQQNLSHQDNLTAERKYVTIYWFWCVNISI